MVQLWIISVNLVFVKYVNIKDSINSFYSFLTNDDLYPLFTGFSFSSVY